MIGSNAQADLLEECEDKHILSDNRSPVILLKIAGMEFPALVDSGSQVSCLSRDVWDQIEGRTDMPIFPVTGVRISGAFKAKPKRITHQALISFQAAEQAFHHEFLLVPELTYAVVLGTDWMRRVEAVIDLGHRCLTVEAQTGRVRIPEATHPHQPASGESLALFISSTWMPAGSLALCTLVKQESDEEQFTKVLDDSNVTVSLRERLHTLLRQNKQVFSEKPGRVTGYEHCIEVTDDSPFQQKAYPIPVAHREAVQAEIERMVNWGIIQKAPTPYISPLVTVIKPDGSVRLCLDARRLNRVLVKDHEQPRPIEDILDQLGEIRVMSSLDLTSSYWQIPVRAEDQKYTGFLHQGQSYVFKMLPFGLATAVASFTRCMTEILGPQVSNFCIAYVDDLLIFSRDENEHLHHLEVVLSKMRNAGFTLKLEKCSFFRTEMKFLGYIIDKEGAKPDPDRVSAIRNFPVPRSTKQLQAFLGLCNYDRRFCGKFSTCAEPLTRMLKKNRRWIWTAEAQKAFDEIKKLISDATLLYRPRRDCRFYVQTDASDVGLGAQLFQVVDGATQVVAYASRLLAERERNYSTSEREALAVVFALTKWRSHLLGVPFTVRTDHQSLKFLSTCRLLSPRISRWALALQEYNYTIEYVAGTQNVIADSLSRWPMERLPTPPGKHFQLFKLKSLKRDWTLPFDVEKLPELQEKDDRLAKVINTLGDKTNERFLRHDGVLYVRRGHDEPALLAVPQSILGQVIRAYHEGYGHFGVTKTWQALKTEIWAYKLHRRVREVVAGCDICQRAKASPHPLPVYQPIIPTGPNDLVAMDLYGPLPKSRAGVTYLFVILDVFSKLVTLYPVKKATTKALLNRVLGHYVPDVGRPKRILTDSGTQFTAASWRRTLEEAGFQVHFTSVRHPQANPSERTMRELGRMFRTYAHAEHTRWAMMVPRIADLLNNVVHESTGFAPVELHYGVTPAPMLREVLGFPPIEPRANPERLILAKECLLSKAARRAARQKVRTMEFKVGDLVLLRANPVSSAVDRQTKKFFLLYEGPYRIKKKIHNATYVLQRVTDDSERGSFHASHLKRYQTSNV